MSHFQVDLLCYVGEMIVLFISGDNRMSSQWQEIDHFMVIIYV